MTNPLGKYGNIVAALIAVLIVVVWLAALTGIGGIQQSDALDTVAIMTVGVVFGTQVVQNGTQTKAVSALAKAEAALLRLDAIHAPSAPAASGSPDGFRHES